MISKPLAKTIGGQIIIIYGSFARIEKSAQWEFVANDD